MNSIQLETWLTMAMQQSSWSASEWVCWYFALFLWWLFWICYISVYPSNCELYYGPHSIECLDTMWTSATCLLNGTAHPSKRNTTQLSSLDSTNIRWINERMRNVLSIENKSSVWLAFRDIQYSFNITALEADDGNVESQRKCFGMGRTRFW